MITTNLRIVAIAGAVALLVFIVDLVRRRRLKEEYTVLWVLTAIVFLLLAAWGALLRELTHAIGAFSQSSTLFFFGILFVISLLLHFSLRVSQLERRVLALLQEIAILSARRQQGEDGQGSNAAIADDRAACGSEQVQLPPSVALEGERLGGAAVKPAAGAPGAGAGELPRKAA